MPQRNTPPGVEEDSQSTLDALSEKTPESSLGELEIPGSAPWLSDLFPSSADSGNSSGAMWTSSPSKSDSFGFSALLAGDDDEIEEIVRQSDPSSDQWLFFPDSGPSPSRTEALMASSIPSEPDLGAASPEMLVLRFNRNTCGILSIKDGMHENPWRTLIWPLAKDTPALRHAIFSMAAFHSSKEHPALRVHGVDHMRKSIAYMVQNIESMRTDAALATSLALAFADTWDQHTRSCIQHLRGAKALVSQVLDLAVQGKVHGADLERVRFLYNTWLYMDVIARLTSRDGCEGPEMDLSIFQLPGDVVHEIDPLMGCAATLFPLINQVAGLVQRVRKSDSNSISLVSQAIELKRLVEQWEPPRWFEPPEDPTSEVQHSIQTAHAYRWATLLYLHQAVPEMPSEPTSELAKRVLILLATVPPSSRTTIIQMFPLIVAGCEAEQEEDRDWVLNRWMAIQSRLMLGGIDRCLEVVREVWTRRDAYKVEQERKHKRSRSNTVYDSSETWGKGWGREERAVPSTTSRQAPRRGSAVSGLENIEHEKTVRGRLHWVNVMEKWGWEGKQELFLQLSVKMLTFDSLHSVPGIDVEYERPIQYRGRNARRFAEGFLVALGFDLDGSSGSFLIAGWRSERVAGSLSGRLLGWSSRYDRREAKYGSSSLVIETVVMTQKDMLICCFLDTFVYASVAFWSAYITIRL